MDTTLTAQLWTIGTAIACCRIISAAIKQSLWTFLQKYNHLETNLERWIILPFVPVELEAGLGIQVHSKDGVLLSMEWCCGWCP